MRRQILVDYEYLKFILEHAIFEDEGPLLEGTRSEKMQKAIDHMNTHFQEVG